MKKILFALMAMIFSAPIFAQNQQQILVYDTYTNAPVQNATILVENGSKVETDSKGLATIKCAVGLKITVHHLSYEDQTLKIEDCSSGLKVGIVPTTVSLNAVEVTATSTTDKNLLQQPNSIVKLNERDLERQTGLFLDDAINTNVPGVIMQRRTISGGQSFNIRGYGNGTRGTNGVSSNFDGQGSKVYLNGIAITDAEGVTLLDDIDFGSVTNVEVSKGPSGVLYGQAIAGVINLQTKKAPKNQTSIGEQFTVGSYGLVRSTTNLSIGTEKSSFLVNFGRQSYDGFMPHTASDKTFVNVMGDFEINKKQTITTYFGYSDSYDERNGELTIDQYNNLDYSGNSRYIKNDAHSAVKSFRAGFGHTYKFNQNFSNTTTFFGSAQMLDNSSAGGWSDKSPLNYGLRSTFDANFKLSDNVRLSGITGIELQQTTAISSFYGMLADSTNLSGYNVIGPVRSSTATNNATASYFTQWTLELPKSFSVTAGVGFSTLRLNLQNRLWNNSSNRPNSTTPATYEEKYNNMLSPSLAINKKLNENTSVYASYSVGYKAPTTSYFYIPYTGQINKDLVPEKGVQFEVGTKGNLLNNRLFYTVAAFNTQYQDKMTTIAVQDPSNTATLYSYVVNGGKVNNTGVEALVQFETMKNKNGFLTSLRPFVNVTYANFKYEDYDFQTIGTDQAGNDSAQVFDYSGNTVAGVPPIVFNVGVDATTKIGLYGNVNFNYRGEMYFTSDNLYEAKSYGILNAKIGWQKTFNRVGVNVFVGANNITGQQYYNMIFVNQLPDAYIPAPNEINFFGGVNLKYTF